MKVTPEPLQEESMDKVLNNVKSNKKRKRVEQKVCANVMVEALNAISFGQSIRIVGNRFNIPKSTLNDKLKHYSAIDCKKGPSTTLSDSEELAIVDWIIYCSERGFPITKVQLLDCVEKYLKEKRIHSIEEIKEQCLINEDTALLYDKSNVEIVGENRENVEHNQSYADNNYEKKITQSWTELNSIDACNWVTVSGSTNDNLKPNQVEADNIHAENEKDNFDKAFPKPKFAIKKTGRIKNDDHPPVAVVDDLLQILQKKEDAQKLKEKKNRYKKERGKLKILKQKENEICKKFQEKKKKLLYSKKRLNSLIRDLKKEEKNQNNKENIEHLQQKQKKLLDELEAVNKIIIQEELETLTNKIKIKKEYSC